MSLYKLFKTDERHETEGIVLDYGNGVRVRVARAGGANKPYLKALERMARKHRRQIQLDILPEEVGRRMLQEIFADTVVLGWEGVTDAGGKTMPFTKENCLKLFEDLPDLFRDIQEQAQNITLFRNEVLEADVKN